MDIFSTIASAIDLAEKLKKYIQDIKDESSERKNLLDEVTALTTLLPLLSARIESAKHSPDQEYQDAIVALSVKNGPLDQFIESLTTLNGKLERAEKGTVKGAVQKLLWPFTLSEIKDKLGRIERFKSLVAFILASQSFGPISNEIQKGWVGLEGKISEVKDGIASLKNDQKGHMLQTAGLQKDMAAILSQMSGTDREKIADWFAPFSSAIPTSTPTSGTGKWYLESDEFVDWENGKYRILYCPGNAGAGKTTLMTIVIQYLQHTYLDKPARTTIHFYFNHQSTTDITVPRLMAYLLAELVKQRALNTTIDKLKAFKDKNSKPSDSDILAMLKEEINSYDNGVYCIFDALDEAPELDRFSIINHLIADLPSKARMIFTFRDLPEIANLFREQQNARRLLITGNDEDLKTYINRVFEENPRLNRLAQQGPRRDEVVETVIKRAAGMFLMGRLMMDQLRAQTTPNGLAAALDKLPSSLDEMYTQTLDRCTDKAKAFRFLSLILLAKRPLTISEIQEAFAWRLGATNPLNDGDLEDEESLLSLCMGLVTIEQTRTPDRRFWGHRDCKSIVFIHYTTKEYFSKLVSNSLLTHADITLLCLDCICYRLKGLTTFYSEVGPFLGYSANHWTDHAIDCPEDEPAKRAAVAVLTDTPLMNAVGMVLRRTNRRFYLHFATETGLYHLIPDLHDRSPHRLNKPDIQGITPLHLACILRHKLVVRALLSIKEIDVNMIDKGGRSPLSFAAENGDIHIVRQLLDHGDVQVQHVNAALIFAAKKSQAEIVEVFLRYKGVDVNVIDTEGRSPLSIVAENGDIHIVRQLLDHSDVQVQHVNAALIFAVKKSQVEIVEVFLRYKGVDVNVIDTEGRSPLSFAAENGDIRIVRQLLDRGDLQVQQVNVALIFAARSGKVEIVEVFLRYKGVDVKESGTIALHEAARMGAVKVVEVLLKEEMIDINAKTKPSGPSPFLKGVKALNLGNNSSEYGYTALHFAASGYCSGVIQVLLTQRDVEVNARSNSGQTPLIIAAHKGRKDPVFLLLGHPNVDVHAEDDERQTALEWAKKREYGHFEARYYGHDYDAVQSLLLDYLERSATGPVEFFREEAKAEFFSSSYPFQSTYR